VYKHKIYLHEDYPIAINNDDGECVCKRKNVRFMMLGKDDAVGSCSQWSNTVLNTHHCKTDK
jgi:hypothetical protein